MDAVVSLLVALTLPQFVISAVIYEAPFPAVLAQVEGDSRIFSGESVRLRCSIPDERRSTWQYVWFRGEEQLPRSGEDLTLWNATPKHAGKFYCQGLRETVVGPIRTRQSLPVEIHVDGGWAILHVTPRSGLVGETLNVTCRIRDNPQPQEVILYKDGIEIMRRKGFNPQFSLIHVSLEDQGLYSCRSTWDVRMRSHSVLSLATPVLISEVLTQPILEILFDGVPVDKMRLICHVLYSARAPAPPIHYYFYKNGRQLGTSTSENTVMLKQSVGQYHCKTRVPQLDLLRTSEPKNFGKETGAKPWSRPPIIQPDAQPSVPTSVPPSVQPSVQPSVPSSVPTSVQPSTTPSVQPGAQPSAKLPSAPGGTAPDVTLPPAVQTAPASASPQLHTVTPLYPLTFGEHSTPRLTQTETLPTDDATAAAQQTMTSEPFDMSGDSASSAT